MGSNLYVIDTYINGEEVNVCLSKVKSLGQMKVLIIELCLNLHDYFPVDRSPKKGFVMADCSSFAADLKTSMSKLPLGRNRYFPPSTLSNPQSSRNFTPCSKIQLFPVISIMNNSSNTMKIKNMRISVEKGSNILLSFRLKHLSVHVSL